MKNRITRIAGLLAALLGPAAAVHAQGFQVWEDSAGAPGATAVFASGAGLQAHLAFDADSAEGGGLLVGATEFEIRPTGSVVLVDFSCALAGCSPGMDYVFTPGGEGAGGLVRVSDPDVEEKHGTHDLGTVEFDAAGGAGGLELIGCNYTGTDVVERRCAPFTLVALPEPSAALALAAGAAALAVLGRRRV